MLEDRKRIGSRLRAVTTIVKSVYFYAQKETELPLETVGGSFRQERIKDGVERSSSPGSKGMRAVIIVDFVVAIRKNRGGF